METKIVLERYARYYDYLKKLGGYPLSESPTIEELGLTKGYIQSCYKEIKEVGFEGNLVDYLCLISTEFILYEWEKRLPKKVEEIKSISIDAKQVGSIEFQLSKKTDKLELFITKCFFILMEICLQISEDGKNMMRLFNKNADWLFSRRVYKVFSELIISEYKKGGYQPRVSLEDEEKDPSLIEFNVFKVMATLRYIFYNCEKGIGYGILYALSTIPQGPIIRAIVKSNQKGERDLGG